MMIFILVLATIFIAEMGDKTQLLLVAMAGKYKVRDILIGTWAATIVLNLLAVAVGAALSNYLDMRIIKTVAALAFFYFSCSTLKGDDDEEEETMKDSGGKAAIFAIFGTFFIGELGDKTQLSAITLAATYTDHAISNAVWVFLGCTIGLILADFIGLLVGLLLKSKMPTKLLNLLSFAIFAIFGVINTYDACSFIWIANMTAVWVVTVLVTVLFAVLCVITARKK